MSHNPNHPPVINLDEQSSDSPAQPQEVAHPIDPVKFPKLTSILMPKKTPKNPIEIEDSSDSAARKDVTPFQGQLPEAEVNKIVKIGLAKKKQIQMSKKSKDIIVSDIKGESERSCQEGDKQMNKQLQEQIENELIKPPMKDEEEPFQESMIPPESVFASAPEPIGEAMQESLHHAHPQPSNQEITPTFNEVQINVEPEPAVLPTIYEGPLEAVPEHLEEQQNSPQPQRQVISNAAQNNSEHELPQLSSNVNPELSEIEMKPNEKDLVPAENIESNFAEKSIQPERNQKMGIESEQNRKETQERRMVSMQPVVSEPSSMVVERQSSDNRSENLQIEALFTSRVRSLCEYPRNQSLSEKNEISVKGSVDIDRDIVKPLIEAPNQEIPNNAQEIQVQGSEQKPHKNQESSKVMIAEEKAEVVVEDKGQQLVQAPSSPMSVPRTAKPIIHNCEKKSVEVEEKQNEVQRIEPPVDDTPIIERAQSSEKMKMEKKMETKTNQKHLFGSTESVRVYLLEKFPEYKNMVETLKEEELQPLLDQFQSLADNLLKTKQPSIESIRSQCITMFPHLSQKILAKTPEEILELWKQIKRESSSPEEITVPDSGQKIVNIKSDSNKKAETPLLRTDRNLSKYPEGHGKRTYHEMLETKPQKESSAEIAKKNKLPITEIRRILIEREPTLEDKINQLSDTDLANIFKQTLQSKKNRSENSELKSSPEESEKKGISEKLAEIPKAEKKIETEIAGYSKTKSTEHISGSAIERANKAVPEDKVHIFEGVDEQRQKKTKTIVMVHTEVDMSSDECQGEEALLKRKNGPQGVELKCACDCCNRTNNVEYLLARLTSILEQKK